MLATSHTRQITYFRHRHPPRILVGLRIDDNVAHGLWVDIGRGSGICQVLFDLECNKSVVSLVRCV